MSINQLSIEILQNIYEYATIQDVIHLSMTSKKHWKAYLGRQLPILKKAFYNSPYGPYPELIKLVISGLPDTNRKLMGTEVRRRSILNHVISVGIMPNLTLDFIQKMVRYAKVADRWTEIYPQLRWRFDSDLRRVLRPHEAERLRCAIYQHWTYCNMFQDKDYCQWDPDLPHPGGHGDRHHDDLRFRLARTWTTIEIVRQSEFVDSLHQLLDIDLFPSNVMIQHRYSRTFPLKELAKYAWGDVEEHSHLGDALMKLTPADWLHLYQNTTTKSERAEYLRTKGRWFDAPYTWDRCIQWMAGDERSRAGWPHPDFPSAYMSANPPYVSLKDQDVKYGIIDCHENDGPGYYKTHVYANDASPTGEWVAEHLRPVFRNPPWKDDIDEGYYPDSEGDE